MHERATYLMLYFSLVISTIILIPFLHWYKSFRVKKLLRSPGKVIRGFYRPSLVLYLNLPWVILFILYILVSIVILFADPNGSTNGFQLYFLLYLAIIIYYASVILKEIIIIDNHIYCFSLLKRYSFLISEITQAKRLQNTSYTKTTRDLFKLNPYNKERLLLYINNKKISLGYFAENYMGLISYLKKQGISYETEYRPRLNRF